MKKQDITSTLDLVCADCESASAKIIDDGIPFALCDCCRKDIHGWLGECNEASELNALIEQVSSDKLLN